jgi:hypothetical protein
MFDTELPPDTEAFVDVSGQLDPHEDVWIRLNLAGAIALRDLLSQLIEQGEGRHEGGLINLPDSEGELYDLFVTISPTKGNPGYEPNDWIRTHYLGL